MVLEPVGRDPFLDACGGAGGLLCAVARGPGALPPDDAARLIAQPYLVVGRQRGADLWLDDPEVSRRHAYFQLIGGRLYGVDLGSRKGTWLAGQPFRAGVVPSGQVLGIGPFAVRFPTSGPTPPRGHADPTLPPVRLEVAVAGARPRLCKMAVPLVLVGSAPICRLRLPDHRVDPIHCSLVRTPHGLWAVDLLTDWGIAHNGCIVRTCRLAPGDRLGVGPYAIRVLEAAEADDPPDGTPAATGLVLAPGAAPAHWPTAALGRLEALERRQDAMQDQFQQTLLMVLQALGGMHRDQMQALAAEVAEVGRLSQAIDDLRAELRARPAEAAGPATAAPPDEDTAEPVHPEPPRVRRDPREVHALVSERLAAFEQERQSRWNRILRTLGGTS